MKKEQIYTTGETMLLKILILKSIKNMKGNDYFYLWEVIKALNNICIKFGTLSEVNYLIHIKKINITNTEYDTKMIETLFHKDLDLMPLLLNDPIIGMIAKFRLQINK